MSQGRRPTKAERKEQARREREELQRRLARRRRSRRATVVVAVLAALGLVAFAATRPGPDVPSPEELLAGAAAARTEAGCGEPTNVGSYRPPERDQEHAGPGGAETQLPPLSTYASAPPASGPHGGATARAGIYDDPPPMADVIHSLEHGAVVIWYDPDAPAEELERIKDFFRDSSNRAHLLVAPYDYPEEGAAGRLPDGNRMALVAWHHVMHCERPSLEAAFDFVASFRFPPHEDRTYRGNAPEPGLPI